MEIDSYAIRRVAAEAAREIERRCYDEDGESDFRRSRAEDIIQEAIEKIAKAQLQRQRGQR